MARRIGRTLDEALSDLVGAVVAAQLEAHERAAKSYVPVPMRAQFVVKRVRESAVVKEAITAVVVAVQGGG